MSQVTADFVTLCSSFNKYYTFSVTKNQERRFKMMEAVQMPVCTCPGVIDLFYPSFCLLTGVVFWLMFKHA